MNNLSQSLAVSASVLLKQSEIRQFKCFIFKDTFDSIPISMSFVSETAAISVTRIL
jgi:hypothetical protein